MNNSLQSNWDVELEPFQMKFFTSRARFPAFVAGWGTGKTMTAILKGLNLSEKYPNNLGLILRREFTNLKNSTMVDFEAYTKGKYKIKAQDKSVTLPNGSKILFSHADELSGVVQNINLGWFYIEQAEEFDSDEVFELLDGRLRRKDCFRQGFIIANTNGHNWIWRKWKNKGGEECIIDTPFNVPTDLPDIEYDGYASLVEAKSWDNARHLPKDTIASWRLKEKRAPALYRRCVENSWEDMDTSDNIIPYEWLMRAVNKELISYKPVKIVIGCDIAEMGDDHTVLYGLRDGKIIAEEITCKKEPMDTAGRIQRMMREISATLAVVDYGGGGFGVPSRLSELGVNHLAINPGVNAEDEISYKSMKAEMWFNAQRMFRDDLVSIPDDDKLIEDLAAHTYSLNSKGQIIIEKKKDVKKKLGGRSPDQGDAFVLGLWGLTKASSSVEEDEPSETEMADSYSVKSVII